MVYLSLESQGFGSKEFQAHSFYFANIRQGWRWENYVRWCRKAVGSIGSKGITHVASKKEGDGGDDLALLKFETWHAIQDLFSISKQECPPKCQ